MPSAAQVDAPLPRSLAARARARVANDPHRLTDVGEQFQHLGALQYAAEAGYAAAHAFRAHGGPRAAARASARATALHADCEDAAIGWMTAFQTTALTRREQQVALLAAASHSDAEIADLLAVSPRTVQAHLLRAYRKLDVTSRNDPLAALTGSRHPAM